MTLPQTSLAFALAGAARVLALVTSGTALPRAISLVVTDLRAAPAARGAIQDLCYRSLRQWGTASALLTTLADTPPANPRLSALLRCALALLSEATPAYADHTLVDQAVSACTAERELLRAKGLVNAVLRRFLRERDNVLAQVRTDETARWNYPQWWIDQVRAAWPADWQAVLDTGNQPPPLTLRVNRRRQSVDDYLALLDKHQMQGLRIGPSAVRLARAVPVAQIPGFDAGVVSVQDAAAQLAAPLLDVRDGMRVLDACAAPGGKTGHLLELADLDLLALDQDSERLQRVDQNLQRLGLSATLQRADARQPDWWDGRAFDRILADVPCTASGIVRRHPDIRWLRRAEDAAQLARQAEQILDNLWQMLAPGGKLLIVTCSIWPEESADLADHFAQRSGAIRLPSPGQLLPRARDDEDHDGLFYALLQKPPV